MNYADDLVLLAKEETVQDRLKLEDAMEWKRMWKKKNKVMGISRQPSSIQIITDWKQPEDVEYFNHVGNMITDGAR